MIPCDVTSRRAYWSFEFHGSALTFTNFVYLVSTKLFQFETSHTNYLLTTKVTKMAKKKDDEKKVALQARKDAKAQLR